METTLIISQTIFYIVASAAILVIGIGTGVIVFYIVRIAKELQKISREFRETGEAIGERIEEIMDRLSTLPFISFLFKKPKNGKK